MKRVVSANKNEEGEKQIKIKTTLSNDYKIKMNRLRNKIINNTNIQ